MALNYKFQLNVTDRPFYTFGTHVIVHGSYTTIDISQYNPYQLADLNASVQAGILIVEDNSSSPVSASAFNAVINGSQTPGGTITEAQVTSLVSDLALKAPLASPTFTGTVTLPGTITVTGATVGTSAPSAGAGGALPATPAGYITVSINGSPAKIAYY